MLWNWVEVSKSLLDEVNVLLVVLDSTSNNEALLWGDVVHDELLEESGIDIVNVIGKTESWHTKGVVAVGSSQ